MQKPEIDPFGTNITPKKDIEDLNYYDGNHKRQLATGDKFFEGVELTDLKRQETWMEDPNTMRDAETARKMMGSAQTKRKSKPGQFETPTRGDQDGISEMTSTDGRRTIAASLEGDSELISLRRGKKKKKKVKAKK